MNIVNAGYSLANYYLVRITGGILVVGSGWPGTLTRFLSAVGISGEIIATPGHSGDSQTRLVDEGYAFTGDLTPLTMAEGNKNEKAIKESRKNIFCHRVDRIYPGHGPAIEVNDK